LHIQVALLPTPKASDGDKGQRTDEGAAKEFARGKGGDLGVAVTMLPTPRANDAEKRGTVDADNPRNGLVGKIQGLLPTPQARDYRSPDNPDNPDKANFKRKVEQGWTIDLNTQIAMMPTPTRRDYKGSSSKVVEKGRNPMTNSASDAIEVSQTGHSTGLRLQPNFVEWLMGFRKNWTKPTAQQSKRQLSPTAEKKLNDDLELISAKLNRGCSGPQD
jgi:hypothetical protein